MIQIPDRLLAELVDPVDAQRPASHDVQWRCAKDPRHVWTAKIKTRLRLPNCPVCLNKRVLTGINDLATLDPEIAVELTHPEQATALHPSAHKKVSWTCQNNPEHLWVASIASRTRSNIGCPYCCRRIADASAGQALHRTHPALAATAVDLEETTTYSCGSIHELEWVCQRNPEHTWHTQIRNRVKAFEAGISDCPTCADRSAIQTPRS